MVKKKSKDNDEKTKLDLATTLLAIDRKDYTYYNNLSDEYKKLYTPFILMRFMSSATNSGGMHDYHLHMMNEYLNSEFWVLNKYPDFQHLLMCLCGVGTKQYHKWIKCKRERKESKWIELLRLSSPSLNRDEIEILRRAYTAKDIADIARANGKSDKEAKEYAKSFEEAD